MAVDLVFYVSMVQFLLAATFVVVPVIAYRYGTHAQRAAEAEVERQGYPAGILAARRITFSESAVQALFPFAIAAGLAAVAALNLAGSDAGRILSWIVQPIVLVAVGLTTAGQVWPVRFIEASFRRSGDASLRGIDVPAFVDAARTAFPAVLRPVVLTRFALATAGSVLVLVLLAIS